GRGKRSDRSGGLAAAPRDEPALQRLQELISIGYEQVSRHLRAGVPEVDVQPFDLLDQQRDRAAGGTHLVARVGGESLAPDAEGLELVLVEALLRRRGHASRTL